MASLAAAPLSGKFATDTAFIYWAAFAIAKPRHRARFLNRDNSAGEWVLLDDAARSGRPFMVLPRDSFLVLDADSTEAGRRLEEIIPAMEADGLRPVVVKSGQAGHRHLFVEVIDRHKHEKWSQWAHGLKIDVRKGGACIRPPLSPHRLGLPVSLAYPANVEEALARLERSEDFACEQKKPIASRTLDLLRNGPAAADVERYWKPGTTELDRSRLVQAIIMGLINAGFGFEEILRRLLDKANKGGAKVQAMTARDAESYVQQSYDKAVKNQRAPFRDGTDALRTLDEIEDVVRSPIALFKGPGGETRRAIMLAHIAIARQRKSLTHGAAVRLLGERVGVQKSTVSKARGVLRRHGFLYEHAPAKKRDRIATEWTLRLPPRWVNHNVTNGNILSSRPHEDLYVSDSDVSHDLWRAHPGLGKTCGKIWQLLEGRTASEIAATRGVKPAAVRAPLNKLSRHGLAIRDASGRWHRTERSLDQVAQELGIAGAGTAQRQRHDEERHAFDRISRAQVTAEIDHTSGEVVNAEKFDPSNALIDAVAAAPCVSSLIPFPAPSELVSIIGPSFAYGIGHCSGG